MGPTVYIDKSLWNKTIDGLSKRSAGRRESACIWAGHRASQWYVRALIFLDDLPGTFSNRRYHRTPREAIDVLFKILREKELQIIADVHTHPTSWVDLSLIDQASPIEYRKGLLAIVFPNFARPPVRIEEVGVHEYLGKNSWRRLPATEVNERILLGG